MYEVSNEFLEALKDSNIQVVESVTASDGTELSIHSGSVSMDSTREIGRTCSLELLPTSTMTTDDVFNLVRSPNIELTVKRGLYKKEIEYKQATYTNLAVNPSFEANTNVTRTNLVTNPSLEVDTTGWVASSSTISRVTSSAKFGSAALQVVATASGNHAYTDCTTALYLAYRATAWVKGEAGKSFLIRLEERTASATVGNSSGGVVVATGAWQKITVGRTFGAFGVVGRVRVENATAGAHTFLVDGVMLEQTGAGDNPYFDGSFTSNANTTYAWTGTAHASTSTLTWPQRVNVFQNVVTNPSFENGLTSWTSAAGVTATQSIEYAQDGGASLKQVPSGTDTTVAYTESASFNATAGNNYTLSAYIYVPAVQTGTLDADARRIRVYMRDSGGNVINSSFASPQAPNSVGWTRLSVSITMVTNTASFTFRLINGATNSATNATYWDNVLLEPINNQVNDYYDGNTLASGDFSYAWSSAAGASTTFKQVGWLSTNLVSASCVEAPSLEWASSGSQSLRIVGTNRGAAGYVRIAGLQATSNMTQLQVGKTYTVKAKVRVATPQTDTGVTLGRRIWYQQANPSLNVYSNQAPNTPGVHDLSVTFTVATTATTADLRLYWGGGTSDLWFDDIIITEGSYNGNYFDGNTADTDDNQYSWTGAAQTSTSTRVNTYATDQLLKIAELVPLGVFSTDEAEQSKSKRGTVKWSGSDRSKKIARNRFIDPYQITKNTALATAGTLLLQSRLAGVACDFSNVVETITANITFDAGADSNPWKSARALFADYGYDLRFDGLGVARAIPIPDPATQPAVFDYGSGATAMVLDGTAKVSLESVYNGVIVSGEGSDVDTPVRAVVWDTDPTSPTYYLSGFGQVPYFFSSPVLTTVEACQKAAATRLARVKGRFQQLSWPSIVNPALEPLDIVTVTFWDKTSTCVIDSLTIPLGASQVMTASARETSIL